MNNDLSDPVDPDAVGVTSGAPDHAADPGEPERLERLTEIIRSSSWFMELLLAARDVRPPDWLLGGGALRDLVWDRLHGRAQPTPPRDGPGFPGTPRTRPPSIAGIRGCSASRWSRWLRPRTGWRPGRRRRRPWRCGWSPVSSCWWWLPGGSLTCSGSSAGATRGG